MIDSGLSEEAYRARPGLSQSALKLLGVEGGPAKFRYGQTSVSTASQKFGTLIHTAILEPSLLSARYVPTSLERTGTKKWDAEEIAATGRRLVKQREFDEARYIADAIRRWSPVARQLLDKASVEQSFFWTDPETGIACKGRADAVNHGARAIIDLKSAEDASYQGFRRACRKWGYAVQAAFYTDGYPLAGGFQPDGFVFLAAEKEEPYLAAAYILESADIQDGRDEYRRLIEIHRQCHETGVWPGYSTRLQTLSLRRAEDGE